VGIEQTVSINSTEYYAMDENIDLQYFWNLADTENLTQVAKVLLLIGLKLENIKSLFLPIIIVEKVK